MGIFFCDRCQTVVDENGQCACDRVADEEDRQGLSLAVDDADEREERVAAAERRALEQGEEVDRG
jgi:hypothetical protein